VGAASGRRLWDLSFLSRGSFGEVGRRRRPIRPGSHGFRSKLSEETSAAPNSGPRFVFYSWNKLLHRKNDTKLFFLTRCHAWFCQLTYIFENLYASIIWQTFKKKMLSAPKCVNGPAEGCGAPSRSVKHKNWHQKTTQFFKKPIGRHDSSNSGFILKNYTQPLSRRTFKNITEVLEWHPVGAEFLFYCEKSVFYCEKSPKLKSLYLCNHYGATLIILTFWPFWTCSSFVHMCTCQSPCYWVTGNEDGTQKKIYISGPNRKKLFPGWLHVWNEAL